MDAVDPHESWLWDQGPAPDEGARAIERALAGRRFSPPAGAGGAAADADRIWNAAQAARTRVRRRRLAWAAAAAVLLPAAMVWRFGPWRADAGRPAETSEISGSLAIESLGRDRSFEAGPGGARIELGAVGWVELAPRSTIARVDLAGAEHAFFLERGGLEARVVAPPRMFQIGTPAGLSVDLGCRYRLEVDAAGGARVAVSLGHVAFEGAGRVVLVPAGASCAADRERGPLSPTWDGGGAELRALVERLDFAAEPRAVDVEQVALQSDTLALWHLLQARSREVRAAAYTRLEQIVGPAPGIAVADREAILAGDAALARAWLPALDWARGAL